MTEIGTVRRVGEEFSKGHYNPSQGLRPSVPRMFGTPGYARAVWPAVKRPNLVTYMEQERVSWSYPRPHPAGVVAQRPMKF